MSTGVPQVDFRDFESGDAATRAAFVQTAGAALAEWGFVIITEHGLPSADVDAGYAQARSLFGLPEAAKSACERPESGRQRGYTPYGLERAKAVAAHDLKEFWQIGRELPEAHPYRTSGQMHANVFPSECPDSGPTYLRLYSGLERIAGAMMGVVAEYLGEPVEAFGELIHEGDSVLRVINYPDVDGAPPAGSVRAAAHEDINLITVLVAANRPGLELLTRDGEWMTIAAPPGSVVCDTGDMMRVLTDGRMGATTHRVVNPDQADGGRMSMPFFLHPRPDAIIRAATDTAPALTARAYLMERLVENGVA